MLEVNYIINILLYYRLIYKIYIYSYSYSYEIEMLKYIAKWK
jgi:hypothetical protein